MSLPRTDVTIEGVRQYCIDNFGTSVNADAVKSASEHFGVHTYTIGQRLKQWKVKRNHWDLSVKEITENLEKTLASEPAVAAENYIPEKDESYVSFGNFNDLKKIISSRRFYPVFITGLSGNGKTLGVEQACACLLYTSPSPRDS